MDEIKEFNLLAAKEQAIKLKHMYDWQNKSIAWLIVVFYKYPSSY